MCSQRLSVGGGVNLRFIASVVGSSRTISCIAREILPKCAISPLYAEAEFSSAQKYTPLQTREHVLDLHLKHVIPPQLTNSLTSFFVAFSQAAADVHFLR